MAGETDRDYDFEADAVGSNNFSAFDQIERAQVHQNAVLSSPVFPPRTHSGYFEEHPGDLWSGHSVRTLAAHYGSDEVNNQEYYWAVRFQFPTSVNPIRDNLLWELHHPYAPGDPSQHMDFGGAIAPFAVHVRRGDLPITWGQVQPTNGMVICWRTSTGNQGVNGGVGPTFEPNMAICHAVYGTWISLLIHIKFRQANDPTGLIEVWANNTGTISANSFDGPPQYSKYNFVSHFYNSARGVNNPFLYFLMGLYRGGGNTDKQDIVIFDGCWRRGGRATAALNKQAAVAKLIGTSGPPPGGGNGGVPDVEPDGWLGGPYQIVTRPTTFGSQADKQRCFKVTVANAGSVTDIGFYAEPQTGTSGTEQKVFVVWPDNGSGTEPGSAPPLGKTATVNFTNASATGRISTPLLAPFAVDAGDIVWVGELTGGQPNVMMARQGAPGAFRLMDQPFTSGVGAWNSTADSAFDLDYTIWLEGTPGTGVPPSNVTAPIITGTAVVGQTLSIAFPAGYGTWIGSNIGYDEQWQRDNGANQYTNIAGQTGLTYVVTNVDVGARIRILLTGTNTHGTGTGASNAIGPIVAVGGTARIAGAGHSAVPREVRAGRRAGEGGGG